MDFRGGLVVQSLPFNAGDVSSIPGWGTKILHAPTQAEKAGAPQQGPNAVKKKRKFMQCYMPPLSRFSRIRLCATS